MKKIVCALLGITTCFGAAGSSQTEYCATICLVKMQDRYGTEYPHLGLQDNGIGLSLPTISIGARNTKKVVLEWVGQLGAKVESIHPLIHIESVTHNGKLVDNYFLVLVNPTFTHSTFQFAAVGDSAHFYPTYKRAEAALLKPLHDPDRSFFVQHLIHDGHQGSSSDTRSPELFGKLIGSYTGTTTGRLTISPELFQIYGEKRVTRETRRDCALL